MILSRSAESGGALKALNHYHGSLLRLVEGDVLGMPFGFLVTGSAESVEGMLGGGFGLPAG